MCVCVCVCVYIYINSDHNRKREDVIRLKTQDFLQDYNFIIKNDIAVCNHVHENTSRLNVFFKDKTKVNQMY